MLSLKIFTFPFKTYLLYFFDKLLVLKKNKMRVKVNNVLILDSTKLLD